MSFTHKKAMLIAIINVVDSRISNIFITFAVNFAAKVLQIN